MSREGGAPARTSFTGSQRNVLLGDSGPPSSISRGLSSHIFGQDDAEDDARQPLTAPARQQTTRDNRERFERNQRTAGRRILERSAGWLILGALIVFAHVILFCYFYVKGWNVYLAHHAKPCDQPLAEWLLVMLFLPVLEIITQCSGLKSLRLMLSLFSWPLLFVGIYLYGQVRSCDGTNPILFRFVHDYLWFLGISWTFWTVMPILAVLIVLYGMSHGWFDEINGANADVIKQMEIVTYDPSLFAEDGRANDTRPAGECCCCQEAFDASKTITRTPCQHYFHQECLGKWLKLSTTCPLCRNDLEEAVQAGQGV